jgi:hypothetical protein
MSNRRPEEATVNAEVEATHVETDAEDANDHQAETNPLLGSTQASADSTTTTMTMTWSFESSPFFSIFLVLAIVGGVLFVVALIGIAINTRDCDGEIQVSGSDFVAVKAYFTFFVKKVFAEDRFTQAERGTYKSLIFRFISMADYDDISGKKAAQMSSDGWFSMSHTLELCGRFQPGEQNKTRVFRIEQEYSALPTKYKIFRQKSSGEFEHFASSENWNFGQTEVEIREVGSNRLLSLSKRNILSFMWTGNTTDPDILPAIVPAFFVSMLTLEA